MKAVLQRVKSASVHVDGNLISSIGPGIVALIGICKDDTPDQMDMISSKLLGLKLWPESMHQSTIDSGQVTDKGVARPWRSSVMDIQGEVLCVSQFTLYAKTAKGSKPDFHQAMPGSSAQAFYNEFLEKLRSAYEPSRIKDGAFGAMMDVSLVNDGPVTIQLDSMEKRKAAESAQEGK